MGVQSSSLVFTGGREWRLRVLSSDMPQTRKWVALVVQTWIDDDLRGQMEPWPDDSYHEEKVAALAGLAPSTFRRHYRALKKEGWL